MVAFAAVNASNRTVETPAGQTFQIPLLTRKKHNLQRSDCKCEGTVNHSKISRQQHPLLPRQSGVSQESTGAAWHLPPCHIRGHIPKRAHTQTCRLRHANDTGRTFSQLCPDAHAHPSYRRQFEGPHLARLYLPVCSFWPSLFIRLIKKSDPPACCDTLTADS